MSTKDQIRKQRMVHSIVSIIVCTVHVIAILLHTLERCFAGGSWICIWTEKVLFRARGFHGAKDRVLMWVVLVVGLACQLVACGPDRLVASGSVEDEHGAYVDESGRYDWRAELKAWQDSVDEVSEEREEQRLADALSEGVHQTLVIVNNTSSSTIIRIQLMGGRDDSDILRGRDLGVGSYLVLQYGSLEGLSIKVYWSDGTVTMHGIPGTGRVILTDATTGYQGTNIYVIE